MIKTSIENWSAIRKHFSRCFRSSMHVSIASVSADGQVTNTPVGSLFLNDTPSGFYFEKYVRALPKNASTNPSVCILGVNSSKWFWLRSLFRGQFHQYPAVKLYGRLGKRRAASELEQRALQRRLRWTKGLKGHEYLWGDMSMVREIEFTHAEPIRLGGMTAQL